MSFLDSEVDYDHLELGIESKINLGLRATYDFKLLTGTFFNDAAVSLPDETFWW